MRRAGLALGWLLAVIATLPAAAQQLEIRGVSPFAAWGLHPSLGVVEDSLTKVGRGTYVRDIQDGEGTAVDSGMVVSLHYVGMLATGQTFAYTERKPFVFRLGANEVIAGWEDGVLGMRVGGRRQLIIPPHLGYGATGDGPIPPDAVLIFDVTLVDARR